MVWQHILTLAQKTGRITLDSILPPLCLRCDAPVSEPESFCASCWQKLNFITDPHCPCCGIPYELARGDLPCPTCLTTPPRYQRARAAVLYDDASRPLILGFKHADQTHLAGAMARMMTQSGSRLLEGCSLIAPVPLHRRRIFYRCYNQSALLADKISQNRNLRPIPDLLTRVRATPPQASLNAAARARNVQSAFAITPRHASTVKNQIVVLVDDVMTTGATVNDCSRALLTAGAAEVRILTFARTI